MTVTRFGAREAGTPPRTDVPGELTTLVEQAAREPDEAARLPIYAQIQDLIDDPVLTDSVPTSTTPT